MIDSQQARCYFEHRLGQLAARAEVSLQCPFHEDRNPSLSVNPDKGVWICHAGCGGGGILDFEEKFSNCDRETARKNADAILRTRVFTTGGSPSIATYRYTDARGRLLYEKLRYEPKSFKYRHEDENGVWIWKQGEKRAPYCLPKLITSANVIYCEGEKDAENVRAALETLNLNGKGFAVTTSGGSNDWRDDFAPYFAGRDVVILPDNDTPGNVHAQQVASAIHRYAAAVKIVELPGLSEKGDVSNFLEKHSAQELLTEIRRQRQLWVPKNATKSLLLTPSQLKEREIESGASEQLVDGLLPRRGPNVAVGDSNIGKSPLVVQLAVCVAAGLPFLGCETKQGKVVLADFENTGLLWDMIDKTTRAVGADPATVEQNLAVVDRDQIHTLDELIELTKDAVLVVVDSFRFLTHGDDSNGKVTMPILKTLSDQKNCWLLVHHIRKGEAKSEEQIEPLVKSDSVIHWLECASGHRSIINQTTNRWAIDARDIRTDLLLRVAAKGRAESAPLYLSRVFDGENPIGYARARGFDFLTERQQEHFKSLLGMTLSFAEMANIVGSKSSASRLLNTCRANGLVENQLDGKYRFVASK